MKDILQDIVTHTHSLGFLPIVKVTGTASETNIESMAEDRSVIVSAKTHTVVKEFDGVFGMPNLDKLSIHLKCPEYKENATIEVIKSVRNGSEIPTAIHFENEKKDFVNDYRLMSTEVINEKLKSVKFKGATWDIEFEPSVGSIQRLKFQSQANSDESTFQVTTDNSNLVFSFGDASTHAGSFVFHANVGGKLKSQWAWPVIQVMSILGLSGDKIMKISDAGAMMITVDSGLAEYNYILPGQTK
jgi:hypothetical protein